MSLCGRATGRALLPDGDIEIYNDDRASDDKRLLATWRRAERPGKDKDDAVPARIHLADKTYDNAPGTLTIIRRAKSMPSTGITNVCCFAQLFHTISRYIS
ncbi:hypothetical protein GGD56_006453 [Rhizobium mongolense]|uniref:Uncharacterized protein n=1 Tax=Rhizobium mongolense TaxID=57676 RepID=A0ABR6IXA4_9HYPH|nr:hypothetical protein [Rhizobium mongolense]